MAHAQQQSSGGQPSARYSAAFEFYGRTPYPLNSRGARIGFLVSDDSEIELSYVRSEQQVLLSDFRYAAYDLQYKDWIGQSMYWSGGVGYREVEIESHAFLESVDGAEKQMQTISEHYRAATLNLAVGLEVAFTENILLGSDLFGVSTPVHWIKKSSDYPDNADDTEENPNKFPYIRDGLRTNFYLLRSYIKVRL